MMATPIISYSCSSVVILACYHLPFSTFSLCRWNSTPPNYDKAVLRNILLILHPKGGRVFTPWWIHNFLVMITPFPVQNDQPFDVVPSITKISLWQKGNFSLPLYLETNTPPTEWVPCPLNMCIYLNFYGAFFVAQKMGKGCNHSFFIRLWKFAFEDKEVVRILYFFQGCRTPLFPIILCSVFRFNVMS